MTDIDTSTTGTEHVTSYGCPECDSEEWHIQNRICSAAAFFDPKITHVECVECGHVEESMCDQDTETEQ